ncbi:hypothetical protein F2Q69_00053032 [Brassica cretica]|uniref:Uncharacterized protein n=1 Tax=Brassica cretica TaxID=69181 RepID=A0A8S9N5P7_BRACR|nr:hypothetical protein F2Q69_00053032 [Brassica cretica]
MKPDFSYGFLDLAAESYEWHDFSGQGVLFPSEVIGIMIGSQDSRLLLGCETYIASPSSMLFGFLDSWPFLAFQIDTACNSDRTDGLTEVLIGSIRYAESDWIGVEAEPGSLVQMIRPVRLWASDLNWIGPAWS